MWEIDHWDHQCFCYTRTMLCLLSVTTESEINPLIHHSLNKKNGTRLKWTSIAFELSAFSHMFCFYMSPDIFKANFGNAVLPCLLLFVALRDSAAARLWSEIVFVQIQLECANNGRPWWTAEIQRLGEAYDSILFINPLKNLISLPCS